MGDYVDVWTNGDPMRAPKGAIVHLNGYIDRIKPDTFDSDAVLTDVSYSINEFQGSEAPQENPP